MSIALKERNARLVGQKEFPPMPAPEQNEFPQPANARPPSPPASQLQPADQPNLAAAIRRFAGQETFSLDPDLRLVLEDQCSAAEGSRWKERWAGWLNQTVNDSLKNYYGR